MGSTSRASPPDRLTDKASKNREATPRDAATLILLRRDGDGGPRVLMGRRGGKARFMPSKIVFPGGAVDPDDSALEPREKLSADCAQRLSKESAVRSEVLALAAIRETFEETGLAIGAPDPDAIARSAAAPSGWRGFLARGLEPRLDALTFMFRAVTPPAAPIRFDARFFLADVSAIAGDPDDFSGASDELADLSWMRVANAQALEPPFITGIVLAEIAALVERGRPDGAPFFRHEGGQSRFEIL